MRLTKDDGSGCSSVDGWLLLNVLFSGLRWNRAKRGVAATRAVILSPKLSVCFSAADCSTKLHTPGSHQFDATSANWCWHVCLHSKYVVTINSRNYWYRSVSVLSVNPPLIVVLFTFQCAFTVKEEDSFCWVRHSCGLPSPSAEHANMSFIWILPFVLPERLFDSSSIALTDAS